MKLAVPALTALLVAAPLAAQTAPTATAPTASAPAPTAPAPATPATPVALTIDTPIEVLAADPRAKAVLDKDIPGLTTHPMYEMFKGSSLVAVQPQSQGQLTDAQIAAVKADLAAIK